MVRKKRVILWAGILVLGLGAVLYPVISKEMKTPRVTWYLDVPANMHIRAVSPNGRIFVAGGEGRLSIAKEGDSNWAELPTESSIVKVYSGGNVRVSDLGTVMFQKYPAEGTHRTRIQDNWYWCREGEKAVHINPKMSPSPKEFLEGSDHWIAVYGKPQNKIGVFSLAGYLIQPIEPPVNNLAGLEKYWIQSFMPMRPSEPYRMQWDFNALDPRSRRYFVRVGTRFEERIAPPVSVLGSVVSYDGHWVAVPDTGSSRVYEDGVLKEKQRPSRRPTSTGLGALRDLFDQYVLRHPGATVFTADQVTGFDLNGKRRIGTFFIYPSAQGYIQEGGDRFYASELGLPRNNENGQFPWFIYISPDGRRIIGTDTANRTGAFVFAIDR